MMILFVLMPLMAFSGSQKAHVNNTAATTPAPAPPVDPELWKVSIGAGPFKLVKDEMHLELCDTIVTFLTTEEKPKVKECKAEVMGDLTDVTFDLYTKEKVDIEDADALATKVKASVENSPSLEDVELETSGTVKVQDGPKRVPNPDLRRYRKF